MKRLVVCCDGTWNEPASDNVTNIEKIARTVSTDPDQCEQVQQLVLYVGGVGIGYKLDRLLGGAFGSGLFNNVKTAYPDSPRSTGDERTAHAYSSVACSPARPASVFS